VQRAGNPFFHNPEQRSRQRHACSLDATSRPTDVGETLSWGAVVTDISTGGVAITLCYPFRPGTCLAVALQSLCGMLRTVMVRVVHVRDQTDGRWRLGCEFLKPLTENDLEMFL